MELIELNELLVRFLLFAMTSVANYAGIYWATAIFYAKNSQKQFEKTVFTAF
jgi:hypothetical protein